jgi:catechol 2,3-dioxygenase-like lactoylglutathione lyase family enzyme
MIKGGNATVFVSDMDRSVAFYCDVLGLKLDQRYGDHWAQIDAGGFMIGLHPASKGAAAPGTKGSIQVGLGVEGSIEDAVKDLVSRGVSFAGPVTQDGPIKLAFFGDPDGNELYLVGH